MGQGASKFTYSEKVKIKKSIWDTYQLRNILSTPEEWEKALFQNIQLNFPSYDCARNKVLGPYTPDVVIKDVGVIDINHTPWNDIIQILIISKIENYMEYLFLPGLLLNFPPNDYPYLRWYYLDANNKAKLETCETIDSDPLDGIGIGVGVGAGIAALVIAAAVGFSSTEKEESESSWNKAEAKPTVILSQPTRLEAHTNSSLSQPTRLEAHAISSFTHVLAIIEESALVTKTNIAPNQSSFYGANRHNQYFNEFCRILHETLHKKGIPFEREKKIYYDNTKSIIPDIYIKDIAVVEVKAKEGGIKQDDVKQLNKYNIVTKLPAVLVNFGTQGNPHIRTFDKE